MLPGTERHPHARAVLGARCRPPARRPTPTSSTARRARQARRRARVRRRAADRGRARPRRACAGASSTASHPDLTWVAPSGAAEMLVGDIDEPVVAAATPHAVRGARRVFVIERADTMNDQAANRMLKTLEEPPSFAHLILLTSRPGRGAADDRLALPARALRRAERRRASRSAWRATASRARRADACARLGARRRRARARAGARRGPGAARGGRGASRARRCAASSPARPWVEAAGARHARGRRGAARRSRSAPPHDARRAAREGAPRAPSARATDAAKRAAAPRADRGDRRGAARSRACGCATSPASPTAREELVHTVDRLAGAARGRRRARRRTALRAAVALVDETRAALTVNPPRSSRSRRSPGASRGSSPRAELARVRR